VVGLCNHRIREPVRPDLRQDHLWSVLSLLGVGGWVARKNNAMLGIRIRFRIRPG
jgi:hypothetical protein